MNCLFSVKINFNLKFASGQTDYSLQSKFMKPAESEIPAKRKPFAGSWSDRRIKSFLNSEAESCRLIQNETTRNDYAVAYSILAHRNASEVIRLITQLQTDRMKISLRYCVFYVFNQSFILTSHQTSSVSILMRSLTPHTD